MASAAFGDIFVSYRREDTQHLAGRLFDRLVEKFGRTRVFMDVDSIGPGVDFAAAVNAALSSCTVLIALIGPEWLRTRAGGRRGRLVAAHDDYVFLEVGTALQKGITVLPVLVDGASVPGPADLPRGLTALTRRNALRVDHESFRSDVDVLLAAIERILVAAATQPTGRHLPPGFGPSSQPPPRTAMPPRQRNFPQPQRRPAGPPSWAAEGGAKNKTGLLVTFAVAVVAVVVAVSVVLLMPASGFGGGGSSPTSTASAPVAWIDKVCGSLLPLEQSLSTKPEINENDPAAALRALSDFLSTGEVAVDQALSTLNAVGPSPIAGGDSAAIKIKSALTTVRSAFDQSRTAIDKIDPNDLAQITSALPQATAPLNELSKLKDPTADFQSNPELKTAAATAPNCQTLNKSG